MKKKFFNTPLLSVFIGNRLYINLLTILNSNVMKKNVIQPVCIIFAAMLMAWSCSKDDSPAPLPEDEAVAVQFSSNIGGIAALAKASGIKPAAAGSAWANNDAIGAFMVNHGSSAVRNEATNKKYVTASGNGNFAPDGAANTVYYPINGDKVDFIAYYPYASSITSLGNYSVNVATQTTPAAIDLLYAKATNNSSGYDKDNASPIALTFSHQLSKLTLNISTLAASTGITAADLTSMTVRIAGLNTQASFNLATGALGTASAKATITPLTVTAGAKYEAILLPDNFSGVSVTFGITAGNNPGNYVWNVPAGAFDAGKEYVYSISFTGAGGDISVTGTINPWEIATPVELGLPAANSRLCINEMSAPFEFSWSTLASEKQGYTLKFSADGDFNTEGHFVAIDAGNNGSFAFSRAAAEALFSNLSGNPAQVKWTVEPKSNPALVGEQRPLTFYKWGISIEGISQAAQDTYTNLIDGNLDTHVQVNGNGSISGYVEIDLLYTRSVNSITVLVNCPGLYGISLLDESKTEVSATGGINEGYGEGFSEGVLTAGVSGRYIRVHLSQTWVGVGVSGFYEATVTFND
jgi:hypothetical protein